MSGFAQSPLHAIALLCTSILWRSFTVTARSAKELRSGNSLPFWPVPRIGRDCNLNAHTLVEGGAVVGDRVTLKSGVFIWSGITLENDVFCGPNATFTNDKRPLSRKYPTEFPQTRVGAGASIGAGAIILPGITIGTGAMIGAGAVVTRDVPAGETWAGNPARRLGR